MEYISKYDVLEKINYVKANFLEKQIYQNQKDYVISINNIWYLLSLFEKWIKEMPAIEISDDIKEILNVS